MAKQVDEAGGELDDDTLFYRLFDGDPRAVDGYITLPDKPGLGIELDYDQVARGRERYARIPFRKRDDEAEMRKHVDPEWKRVLPRW